MKRGAEPAILLHIRDALRLTLEYGRAGESAFKGEPMRRDAVLRQLEIVGEATKRLPQAFRDAHPDVPWKRIAGFRDVVIHHYDTGWTSTRSGPSSRATRPCSSVRSSRC